MAFTPNYYDKAPPSVINLQVKDWDYTELLKHIARVIGKPLSTAQQEDILGELKKLEPLGWHTIVRAVEALMQCGKSQLNNNVWSLLLSTVNGYLSKKASDNKSQPYWFVPEWERSYDLISFEQKVTNEILLWIKYAWMGKPLLYGGKPVVYNPEGLSVFTAEEILSPEDYAQFRSVKNGGISIEMWRKYKRHGSWCILHEVYMSVIEKALEKEYDQNKPDNNAMKNTMLKFINHLITEREKQTKGK